MKKPIITIGALLLGLCAVADEGSKKPNVLFIFADDFAFNALQSVDSMAAHTPNLDRLRANGVMFNHAYNQGSWSMAVCVASRTMLNTGLSVWHAAPFERRAPKTPVWSQTMRAAGYETYFAGKWHGPGVRPQAIFDHVGKVRGGMPPTTPASYQRKFDGSRENWTPSDPKFKGYWEGGTHWSEVTAKDGCGFLKAAAQKDTPFFMYIAFNAPHDPRQSSEKYVGMYPADSIRIPTNFLAEYPYAEAIGCGRDLRDEKLAPFPRTPRSIQVNRAEYYAIITHLDEQIGKVLASLDESGKAANTYIVFSADQGLSVGEHGLLGKQNLYESAIRVPMYISGPGIKRGATSNAQVYIQDIVPTLYELCGIKTPQHLEFQSFASAAKKPETSEGHQYIYGAILGFQRMIRDHEYKLIIYPKAGVLRLFNVKNDPHEMRDLAKEKSMRSVADKLFRALQTQQKKLDDNLDLNAVYTQFYQ